MSRIDLFLKSLESAFIKAGEIAPWPIHVAIPSIYGSDYEASDLYSKLKKIYKEEQPVKILSKLQVGPSCTKALLMDLICGLKVAKPSIPKKERVWFVESIFDAVEMLQSDDIFCLKGKNLILNPTEVKDVYEKTPWILLDSSKSKRDLASSLYKASASVKSLIWSLFFYGWDDVGYEIHGPYDVKVGKSKKYQMIITDYFDLKPTLLWPEMESFPYNKMKLICLYKKEAKLSVDIFIHFVNKGNLLDNTVGIYLEADGVPVRTKEAAESLSKTILERVTKQHNLIDAMSKEEIIKKYIESRYYAFRKWRFYFNEDWRPPKKVLDRIKKWGIIDIPLGKGPSLEELKKAFDPRTNFVPGKDK